MKVKCKVPNHFTDEIFNPVKWEAEFANIDS